MSLIDADALKNDILKSAVMIDDRGIQTGYEIAIELIKRQPTIDAEPVRHGKWTADEILYTQGMTACSCCKTEYYRDDLYMVGNNAQGELPNYCPNCGARMDEE